MYPFKNAYITNIGILFNYAQLNYLPSVLSLAGSEQINDQARIQGGGGGRWGVRPPLGRAGSLVSRAEKGTLVCT